MKKIYDDDAEVAATQVTGSLVGPYRTGEVIGTGGMANVVDAVDIRTGERVALKILHSRCSGTSEVVSRFIREGRALQKMNHPNIVRVIDHGVSDAGDAWIAMERLEGISLSQLVTNSKRLQPERALHLLTDIAKALATVHARGMIHRDIKPENIIIVDAGTPNEQARLIDFGVAHVTDEDLGDNSIEYTNVTSLLGSAAFMAPEQLSSSETTAASDTFAFGVSLYECLTGELPFDGATMMEQLVARRGPPTPLKKRVRGTTFDPALEAFLVRCLAPEPSRRPENGLALLRELKALQGQPPPESFRGPPSSANGSLSLRSADGATDLRAGSSLMPHVPPMPGTGFSPVAAPGARSGKSLMTIAVVVAVALTCIVVLALEALRAVHK